MSRLIHLANDSTFRENTAEKESINLPVGEAVVVSKKKKRRKQKRKKHATKCNIHEHDKTFSLLNLPDTGCLASSVEILSNVIKSLSIIDSSLKYLPNRVKKQENSLGAFKQKFESKREIISALKCVSCELEFKSVTLLSQHLMTHIYSGLFAAQWLAQAMNMLSVPLDLTPPESSDKKSQR